MEWKIKTSWCVWLAQKKNDFDGKKISFAWLKIMVWKVKKICKNDNIALSDYLIIKFILKFKKSFITKFLFTTEFHR